MSNVPGKKGVYRGKVHPQVEVARQSYGIPHFYGHRSVFTHENALEKQMTVEGPSLTREERLTCPDCARFKTDHDWQACDNQGKLF